MPLDPSIILQAGNIPQNALEAGQAAFNLNQAQINAPLKTQALQAGIAQTQQETQNAQLANQTNQLSLASAKLSALTGLMNGVKDQDTYNSHAMVGIQSGILPPDFLQKNPNYEPDKMASYMDTVQAQKQQLDLQTQQADVALKQAQAQKTQREVVQLGMFLPQGQNNNPGMPVTPSTNINGRNEDFLSQLSPAVAAQIKGIANGDLPMPTGRQLTTPYGQSLMNAVMQYDPSASAINLPARQKTRQSFTSGQDAANITALNTAIAHLGKLSNDYNTLNNSSLPWWNAITNTAGNIAGNPQIQTATSNVDTDATATAHELAKVFRSSGMSESEVKDWQDKITTSKSPAQAKAVIDSAIDLMDGRLNAIGEKYNQGMGTNLQGVELLSPAAQKVYHALKGTTPQSNSQESNNIASEPLSAQSPIVQQQLGRQNLAGLQQKVQLARQMGYSDAEIQAYLGGQK